MSIRPFRDIKRKKTKKIKVGKVEVGGDAPISVQSMTNTLTTNIAATIKQVNELSEAGADIVRISCPDKESSMSLKKIIGEKKYGGICTCVKILLGEKIFGDRSVRRKDG